MLLDHCNHIRYNDTLVRKDSFMIESFRDKWLKDLFIHDKRSRRIPHDIESRVFRKLEMINFATCDMDLRSPPSNHFEKLSGNLEAYCSIRVNKQWRLVFEWDNSTGTAFHIYLDDHSYR